MPSLKSIVCLPTGRVALVTPSTGTFMSRPLRRHHWRMSFNHLVPSAFGFFCSNHTARLVAALWSALAIHTAT